MTPTPLEVGVVKAGPEVGGVCEVDGAVVVFVVVVVVVVVGVCTCVGVVEVGRSRQSSLLGASLNPGAHSHFRSTKRRGGKISLRAAASRGADSGRAPQIEFGVAS